MAESECMKEIVNQAAIQVAAPVIIALRNAEAGPWPTTMASQRESQRQSQSGTIQKKTAFNWSARTSM